MLRRLFSTFTPTSYFRFSRSHKHQISKEPQQVTEHIAQQQLEKYIKQDRENNNKIKLAKRGHLDFYAYLGTLSMPFFISGLAVAGVIISNPTSALIPWLYSTYVNIGTMTMMGFCGLDMATLVVHNVLNPEVTETISNRLRIALYGLQATMLMGAYVSGYFAGPEVNVILLEAVAFNMVADFSIKQANAKWHEKKKNIIMSLYGLMLFAIFTLTNKHKESLKIQKPLEPTDVSLKLKDHK